MKTNILWRSDDKRLLPADAAGKFAAETFDPPRDIRHRSFKGSWANRDYGLWTFDLVDGVKTYALEWCGYWCVTEFPS